MVGAKRQVQIEPFGYAAEVSEDETILQGLLRQGWMVPHGCRHGDCGHCKVLVVEGRTTLAPGYSRFALSDAERDEGYVLMCSAHAKSDVVIEFESLDELMHRPDLAVKTFEGTVEAKRMVTADMCQLDIRVEEGNFSYQPGQYIDLYIGRTGEVRSYSISNPYTDGRRVSVLVRRTFHGLGSTWVHKFVKIGDRLRFEGPYGTAHYRPSSSERVLLVAGGSGIGMIKAIAEEALARGDARPLHLYYGARTPKDFAYLEVLEVLRNQHPNFAYTLAISEKGFDEWEGKRGVIADVLETMETRLSRVDLYLAGPPIMVNTVLAVAERKGIERNRVYYDAFLESDQTKYSLLRRSAEPILRELSTSRGMTLSLSQLERDRDVCVLRQDGTKDVIPPAVAAPGKGHPAALTSAGICQLSLLAEERLRGMEETLAKQLEEGTARSPKDLSVVYDRIRLVRERGYAAIVDEQQLGIGSVGIPVRLGPEDPAVAISLHAYGDRFKDPAFLEAAVALLREVAHELRESLEEGRTYQGIAEVRQR